MRGGHRADAARGKRRQPVLLTRWRLIRTLGRQGGSKVGSWRTCGPYFGLWRTHDCSNASLFLCRTSRRHRLPVGGYEAVSNASCVCARYLGPQQGHQDVGPHGRDAGRPRGGLAGGLCSGLRLHKRRPLPVLTLQRPTVLLVIIRLRQRHMARSLCKLHTDPRSTAYNTDLCVCACGPQRYMPFCVMKLTFFVFLPLSTRRFSGCKCSSHPH